VAGDRDRPQREAVLTPPNLSGNWSKTKLTSWNHSLFCCGSSADDPLNVHQPQRVSRIEEQADFRPRTERGPGKHPLLMPNPASPTSDLSRFRLILAGMNPTYVMEAVVSPFNGPAVPGWVPRGYFWPKPEGKTGVAHTARLGALVIQVLPA